MSTTSTPTSYAHLDVSDWSQVHPCLQAFLDDQPDSPEALRQWVLDLSRLGEVIYEFGARKNIDNACHTDDADIEAAFMHWVREIAPKLQPVFFELQKHLLNNPHVDALDQPGEKIMRREWAADVEIFRPENVPLQTQIMELTSKYDKLMGALTIDFRGETYTPQQMGRFLDETDRTTRREAWEATTKRRLAERDAIDDILDPMLQHRQQVASNADFADFRDYIWHSRHRFDYTPDDCLAFGRAVEQVCMPVIDQIDTQRREALGVDSLKPWDTAVDPRGRKPLRPFDPDDIDSFVAGVRQIFDRISPDLAEQFDELSTHGNLDLDSRRGKRPGGFQASLEAARQPFIFMNAAGVQGDVDTLLHEGGHAFHYLASRSNENLFTRHAPIEFCEVASMSMELLAMDHFDVFYDNEEDATRAKREMLEDVIRKLPWIATIDGFQHWLYTHPGHTRAQRTDAWLELRRRFGSPVLDWSDHTDAHEAQWQRQGHIFHVPFYYIEYGIAQLGALGVWLNYKQNPDQALTQLLDAFKLGGTAPLPQLFETAGVPFEFSEKTITPLITRLREELDALPV